jgi:hypothetical protein
LLEAVFFTVRVSVALNERDNLYKFFSTRRRSCLSVVRHADFRAFIDRVVRAADGVAALTRFAVKR